MNSSQEITTLNDQKCVVEMDLSEDLENSSFNPQESRFDQIVGAIEEILMEEEFQSVMREFCDKYCQEFDENCEVNKLEYTSWFNEYVCLNLDLINSLLAVLTMVKLWVNYGMSVDRAG